LKLFLFTTDVAQAVQAEAAGIDSIIVDWECEGKADRQCGYDLETNRDTPEDVSRLAQALRIPVTVRVNRPGPQLADEVECAIDHGGRILMLPLAEHPDQVSHFLDLVQGRAETIMQIETQSLVEHLTKLKALAWDYAYIGLNDLMVSRGGRWIWHAVLDGTVEHICRTLAGRPVGFGGVTIVGGGRPIRFTLLFHEMARLGCGLSMMRRTFKGEILDRDLTAELRAVRTFWEASRRRGPKAVASDHNRLMDELRRLEKEGHPQVP